jgi:hypothetical protein
MECFAMAIGQPGSAVCFLIKAARTAGGKQFSVPVSQFDKQISLFHAETNENKEKRNEKPR